MNDLNFNYIYTNFLSKTNGQTRSEYLLYSAPSARTSTLMNIRKVKKVGRFFALQHQHNFYATFNMEHAETIVATSDISYCNLFQIVCFFFPSFYS